jgi:hypothetical protein
MIMLLQSLTVCKYFFRENYPKQFAVRKFLISELHPFEPHISVSQILAHETAMCDNVITQILISMNLNCQFTLLLANHIHVKLS